MKKHIINFLVVSAIGLASYAQTSSDGYQYARTQNFGSARFQALGGAFGALGGDLSAMSANPASSAVFSTSFGSLTIGSNNKDFSSSYFGTTTDTQRNNVVFDQIGAVLVMKPSYNNSKIKKIALSTNYQLEADYRNNILFGHNQINNSLGNYFVETANGIPVNVLGGDFTTAGEFYGGSGEQSFLAFNSRIISNDSDNSYFVEAGNNNIQNVDIVTSGHKSKFTLNGAVSYNTGLHIGANINVHRIDRNARTSFNEIALDNTNNILYDVTYTSEKDEFAAGISLGIGLIQKIKDFRLGLSYQSPTWYEFSSETRDFTFVDISDALIIDQDGDARNIETPDTDNEIFFVDPDIISVIPDYGLRTPGKISGSLAYVFGKNGLISAQYDRQDFSKTKFDSRFENSSLINERTKNTFQAVNTFRIGAEARAEQWRFRAGANLSTSPYKDDTIDGETKGYSLGIGYDWGKWKIDAAYVNTTSNYNETPFENNSFSNSGNVDVTRDQISVTLGVNF